MHSDGILQVSLLLLNINPLQTAVIRDAPPTAGDPLITSHPTWTGLLHKPSLHDADSSRKPIRL